MVETLRKLLMGLALAGFLPACPGPKPPVDPCKGVTCPPDTHCEKGACVADPKVPKYTDLLLTPTTDGRLQQAGSPHLIFGFIPCWDGDEIDHQGWPGIDDAGMDYALGYGANAFTVRLGPFKKDDRWPNSLMYGMGPYVNDDPAQGWNEEWWERVKHIVDRAGQNKATVEIDLIDGWACKHASWGDFESPWSQADVEACTNHITPVQEEWLNKIVSELGCYGNVTWQDGNEVGVSGRYTTDWSLSVAAIVRNAEQAEGCGLRHMLGTNSGVEATECSPQFDFSATHSTAGIDGPHCGKPRENNEHNPNPLYTPEQETDLYCLARLNGQTWWYWRGGASKDVMNKTMQLWSEATANNCAGHGTDECPFDVPHVSWVKVKPHGTDYYDATPLVNNGAYCRSIGFPPGQTTCPVRQEGDPFREPCEYKSLGGGQIQWALKEVEGDISIEVRHQGFQFLVKGNGSARVECYAYDAPGVDICKNGQGGTLYISR